MITTCECSVQDPSDATKFEVQSRKDTFVMDGGAVTFAGTNRPINDRAPETIGSKTINPHSPAMMDIMGGMSMLMDPESGFSPDMLPPMTFKAKIQDPEVHTPA